MTEPRTTETDGLVQVRIDQGIKVRAEAVLSEFGLSVADAVRILLTRIAREGALPFGLLGDGEANDVRVRHEIQKALDDESTGIPDDEIEAEFAARRAALRARLG